MSDLDRLTLEYLLTGKVEDIIDDLPQWKVQGYLEVSRDWERQENSLFQLGRPNRKVVSYQYQLGKGSIHGQNTFQEAIQKIAQIEKRDLRQVLFDLYRLNPIQEVKEAFDANTDES